MGLIADQWAAFEATVVGPDAPPGLRREMKRAFYGGMAGALPILAKTAALPAEQVVARLDELLAEIKEWADRMSRGEE
jgi:hypothetical protein